MEGYRSPTARSKVKHGSESACDTRNVRIAQPPDPPRDPSGGHRANLERVGSRSLAQSVSGIWVQTNQPICDLELRLPGGDRHNNAQGKNACRIAAHDYRG